MLAAGDGGGTLVRWRKSAGESGDLQDMRGSSGRAGGIPGGFKGGAGGVGVVGIIIALLFTFLGGGGSSAFSPDASLNNFPASPPATGGGIDASAPDPDADLKAFMTFVINDVQDSWKTSFEAAGRPYERTTLVLFSRTIGTGCGAASSETGPFYCPRDRRVYLDLAFFRELRDRFGAPGDFAQAYVIAHEVGHHVQNLLGILPEVSQRQQSDPGAANELSVRLELQADCFAGVWAHTAYQRQILESGDLEEGLTAAAAIGDDRLQQQAGQQVSRESFTHGSSEQRTRWFLNGFKGGDVASCDTFSADPL
jgi:predicted metalloprotease